MARRHHGQITYHTIVTSIVGNTDGTISPSGHVQVANGSNQTFTITPDPGYFISKVIIDGVPLIGHPVFITGEYTFYNVTENHSIEVSFSNNPTIHIICGENGYVHGSSVWVGPPGQINIWGEIFPPGDIKQVWAGEHVHMNFYANPGYMIDDVKDDGVSIGAVFNHNIYNVQTNKIVEVSFKQRPTVTIVSSVSADGGTISPLGTTYVSIGDSQSYTITPAPNRKIHSIEIDGQLIYGDPAYVIGEYTFNNVTENHTIHVIFSSAPPWLMSLEIIGNGAVETWDTVYTVHQMMTASINYPIWQIPPGTPVTAYMNFLPGSGATIQSVIIDGMLLSTTPPNPITFPNVTSNHAVKVVFSGGSQQNPKIKAGVNNSLGGSITPSGTFQIPFGSNQVFNIVTNPGYVIQKVEIDGHSDTFEALQAFNQITSTGVYAFNNVVTDRVIGIVFEQVSSGYYVITAGHGVGGSISPMQNTVIAGGSSQVFTITPDIGFQRDTVLVNGINNPGAVTSGQYQFTNVQSNQTIHATFKSTSGNYVIISSASAGGTISPLGNTNVAAGGSQVYTIAPLVTNPPTSISSVLIDGVYSPDALSSAVTNGNYTFSNVQANRTIHVNFIQLEPVPPPEPMLLIDARNVSYDTSNPAYTQAITKVPCKLKNPNTGVRTWVDLTNPATVATLNGKNVLTAEQGFTNLIKTTTGTGQTGYFYICHWMNTIRPLIANYNPTNAPITVVFFANTLGGSGNNDRSGLCDCSNITPVLGAGGFRLTAWNDGRNFWGLGYAGGGTNNISLSTSGMGYGNINQDSVKMFAFSSDPNNPGLHHGIKSSISSTDFTPLVINDGKYPNAWDYAGNLRFLMPQELSHGTGSPTITSANTMSFRSAQTASGKYALTMGIAIYDRVLTDAEFYWIYQNKRFHAANFYKINAFAEANGTISPAGDTFVEENENQSYTITPNNGYMIDLVLVDGVIDTQAINQGSYTFNSVQANHTIRASFKTATQQHTITVTQTANGTITPGTVSVNPGSNQTFTFAPASGYSLMSVVINGVVNQNAIDTGTYTFTNILSNHTVTAYFGQNLGTLVFDTTLATEGTVEYSYTSGGPYITVPPNAITQVKASPGTLVYNRVSPNSGYILTTILTGSTLNGTDILPQHGPYLAHGPVAVANITIPGTNQVRYVKYLIEQRFSNTTFIPDPIFLIDFKDNNDTINNVVLTCKNPSTNVVSKFNLVPDSLITTQNSYATDMSGDLKQCFPNVLKVNTIGFDYKNPNWSAMRTAMGEFNPSNISHTVIVFSTKTPRTTHIIDNSGICGIDGVGTIAGEAHSTIERGIFTNLGGMVRYPGIHNMTYQAHGLTYGILVTFYDASNWRADHIVMTGMTYNAIEQNEFEKVKGWGNQSYEFHSKFIVPTPLSYSQPLGIVQTLAGNGILSLLKSNGCFAKADMKIAGLAIYNGVLTDDQLRKIYTTRTLLEFNSPLRNPTITATCSDGTVTTPTSTIAPDGKITVPVGSTITFTFTRTNPFHALNAFYIDGVLGDPDTLSPAVTYTFTNVTSDHTVHAVFGMPMK